LQLVSIQGDGPVSIKTEIVEPMASTSSTMDTSAEGDPNVTSEPTKSSDTKETPQIKKKHQFRPKVTLELS
jgi:hypothetical protein